MLHYITLMQALKLGQVSPGVYLPLQQNAGHYVLSTEPRITYTLQDGIKAVEKS